MTDKQKLKSLEAKMQRIEKNNPEIDFQAGAKKFFDIQKYYNLRQEHFHLQFKIKHCQSCGLQIY